MTLLHGTTSSLSFTEPYKTSPNVATELKNSCAHVTHAAEDDKIKLLV
jgi:hypothetical protein